MNRVLLVLVLLLGACAKTEEAPKGKVAPEIADQGPRLVGRPPTVQVELPPRMLAALATSDSSFVTLTPFDFVKEIVPGDTTGGGWRYPYDGRQAPFAVIGDFDGDTRDDVALLQRAAGGAGRLVFVFDRAERSVALTARRWDSHVLGEDEKSGFYLTRFPAGAFRVPDFGGTGDTARTIDLPHEGVEASYYGKAATTYYRTGEGFESVTTGD